MRYINSQGVALLVELLKRARRDDRTLIACGLRHISRDFEITRLSISFHCTKTGARLLASPRKSLQSSC